MKAVEVTLYLTGVTNPYIRKFNELVSGQKGTHIGVRVGEHVYHVTLGGFKRTRFVNFTKVNNVEESYSVYVCPEKLKQTIEAFQNKEFNYFAFSYACLQTLFKRLFIKLPSLKENREKVLCSDFPSFLIRDIYCSHYLIPSETFKFLRE